ncbi:hypothetical protein PV325_002140 [Microctonus aethiopoides]|nr:hypothetical protein PV325_002140 [Microctonus aethiopoides]
MNHNVFSDSLHHGNRLSAAAVCPRSASNDWLTSAAVIYGRVHRTYGLLGRTLVEAPFRLTEHYACDPRRRTIVHHTGHDNLEVVLWPRSIIRVIMANDPTSVNDPGLLKGSVTAERPRTLRRLRNVYGPTGACVMGTGGDASGERLDDANVDNTFRDRDRDEKSLSIMSPFDEQEEWAKISEIMASFGTGLVRESVFVNELEKEFQSRLGFSTEVTNNPTIITSIGQWLSNLGLSDYESLFVNYGYDDPNFINGVLIESDLKEMGITSEQERAVIMNASLSLTKTIDKHSNTQIRTIEEWLKGINLENYLETFKKHLYNDMERVKRVWEVELAAVLEIQKPGHRRRILASVTGPTPRGQTKNGGANLEDLNKDLFTLKTNIQQLKEEIREKLPESPQDNGNSGHQTIIVGTNAATSSTLRHRKNRPAPQPPQRPISHNGTVTSAPEQLEIRAPSELLFGVPSTLKTQWRHQPKALVSGSVMYVANYLGSTVVKELRGTESTKKSIQKLKKTCRDPRVSLGITLAISYRGVRFLDSVTREPICDHEIRNIHCACQDADDLTHFAYITKDHASRTHFCHVFCVPTMDQATEVILTLGQAFEVAYQMALKEKLGGQTVRSQSANQLASIINSSNIPTTNVKTAITINQSGNARANNTDTPINIADLKNNSSSNKTNSGSSNNTNIQNTNTLKSKSKTKLPNTNVQTTNYNSHGNMNISSNSNSHATTTMTTSATTNTTTAATTTATTTTTTTTTAFTTNSGARSGSNCTSGGNTNANPKPLVTHGRSHSVNDIKINGNQLKLAPIPVDDIGIGVKEMKAGSRAPIALSEEL